VIVPAHNAATTLGRTLESLQSQTHQLWEAIVVDDGSTDTTAEIAAAFARSDNRICAVGQRRAGVAAARNTGLRRAGYEWTLFVDDDDWLGGSALERLAGAVVADSPPDAVYCGWARVGADDELLRAHHWDRPGDLFPAFARICAFPVHACLVRGALVRAVGGFDNLLRTCEDWDLWQRIARTGARFETIAEVLVFYRLSVAGASLDPWQLWSDGLRVIERGHSPDPRVRNPHPAHAPGAPRKELAGAKLTFACWAAGLLIARGADARPLLAELEESAAPGLDSRESAELLFGAIPLAAHGSAADWATLGPVVNGRLDQFLAALESRAQADGLAVRMRETLDRLTLAGTAEAGA
jgi:GT2 family glycosyltransferase